MRELMVFAGWVAVVCSFLFNASEYFTVVFVLLGGAIAALVMTALNAIDASGPQRAFGVGFAVSGVFFLLLMCVQDTHRSLATSRLLG